MDLEPWIFDKYLPRNLNVRDDKTRTNYKYAYYSFCRFLGRRPELPDLNDDTFAEWMGWMFRQCELGETTVNGYAAKLKAFWEWAARKAVVDQFPTVGRLAVPERLPVAWREPELVKIFNGCRSMRGWVGDVPAWRFWTAIHGWWWCTAERAGATFSLRPEHLRLDDGVAVVPAAIRKGGLKTATYRLWPDLVEMLRSMLPPHTKPRELVFDWDRHWHRGTFYYRYDRMLERLSLPHDRYRKPHAMRVSHASWLTVMGGDPTRALGHSDPATTRRSYIDATLALQDDSGLFRPWDQTPPPGSS